MTACSRHCKNGHCTPTGKCCCSPGWEGPFCRIGGCLHLFTCTVTPSNPDRAVAGCVRAHLGLFFLLCCSQMWASLPQRRSVYGAQQVPVQEWLFWGPLWEEWGGYAQWPRERRHTGPLHQHDVVPPRPDQLYRIGVRGGGWVPPTVTLKSTQIYLPPPADSNMVSLTIPHTAYTRNTHRHRYPSDGSSSSSLNSSSSAYKLAALKHQAWNLSRAHRVHGGHVTEVPLSLKTLAHGWRHRNRNSKGTQSGSFQSLSTKKKKTERKAFQRELRLFRVAKSERSESVVLASSTLSIVVIFTHRLDRTSASVVKSWELQEERAFTSFICQSKKGESFDLSFASAFWAHRHKQLVHTLGSASSIDPQRRMNDRVRAFCQSQSQTALRSLALCSLVKKNPSAIQIALAAKSTRTPPRLLSLHHTEPELGTTKGKTITRRCIFPIELTEVLLSIAKKTIALLLLS